MKKYLNDKEKTREFYDAIAEKSFEEWFNKDTLLPVLSGFVTKLADSPRVLDLGCGTGGESKRLAGLGALVTGIDFSEQSIQLARDNVPGAEFLLMNILDMDFTAGSFDGILDAAALFHFTEAEQISILKKIAAMTRPDGRFLSFYPEGDTEGLQEMDVNGKVYHRYVRMLPAKKWASQVLSCGFSKYKMHGFHLGPFKCLEFFGRKHYHCKPGTIHPGQFSVS